MIFKLLLPGDIKTQRSFLNQLIDVLEEDISSSLSRKSYDVFVTGGVGPGVTSSLFQTVYDQDFSLQTANAIFDVTIGLNPDSDIVSSSLVSADAVGKEIFPSSSLMMREKMNIYRQFAQSLLGDSTSKFYSAYDSTSASDRIDAGLFFCFKRLFSRDQIKRETFAMKFYQTASYVDESDTYTNTNVTSESGSAIYSDIGSSNNKLVSFGGLVGNVVNAVDTSVNVGLIFYDRGIVVLDLEKVTSSSQMMSGTIAAMNSAGSTVLGGAKTETSRKAAFIPDFVVSGSIDDIIDHICSCRFQSGSLTSFTFQNVTNINSTLVFCRAEADEFNYSANPTFTDADSRIVVIDRGSEDTQQTFTYVTSIGLYDATDNLLAVAKTSRPIEKNPERDLTFRLRMDF